MPPYPVNTAALVAAEAVIRDVRTLKSYVRDVTHSRRWFEKELLRLGATSYPSAANFVLANFGPQGPALFKQLEAKGILVRERREFRPGFARITIGTGREMKRLVREIETFLCRSKSS
jgi:histidinol-phosphate aminotransferase